MIDPSFSALKVTNYYSSNIIVDTMFNDQVYRLVQELIDNIVSFL